MKKYSVVVKVKKHTGEVSSSIVHVIADTKRKAEKEARHYAKYRLSPEEQKHVYIEAEAKEHKKKKLKEVME